MFCTTADSHGPSVHVLEAIIIPLFRNTLTFVLTSLLAVIIAPIQTESWFNVEL